MQAFEEVAVRHGFSCLKSFTLPIAKGVDATRRRIRAFFASVSNRPTVLRWTDDPATVR